MPKPKKKLKLMGWTAYCLDIQPGTACSVGPWRGWTQPSREAVVKEIAKQKPYLGFKATLVPARLYAEVPKMPRPVRAKCVACSGTGKVAVEV